MIDQGITSLDTGAPDITYSGNEGPRSPEQEQLEAAGIPRGLTLEDAVKTFELSNERPPNDMQELLDFFNNRNLSEGPPLPNDPTEPVNPFGPKPIGPVLPREMAAFGGIMGLDQRRQYGIGSKFKKAFNKVTSPFTKLSQKLMPKELAGIAQFAAPFAGPYAPLLYAAGAAKQRGKINPMMLAMMAAPYARMTPGEGLSYGTAANNPGSYGLRDLITGGGRGSSYTGESLFDKVGAGDYGLKTDEFIFGAPSEVRQFEGPTRDVELTKVGPIDGVDYGASYNKISTNPGSLGQGKIDATSGLLGKGGEMYQAFGGSGDVGIADTIIGQKAFLDAAGKPSMLKLGSWAIGIVSGIQAGKYKDEQDAADAAEAAALAADSEASATTLKAARDWAIETFGSMSVYADGGRVGYGLGNLIKGSAGVFQPTSASMSAGDAPSFEGGSGMGGMIADLIRKNPNMFKRSKNTTPVNQSNNGMYSKMFNNSQGYFIDENENGIDDRREVATGGRINRNMGGGFEGIGSMPMQGQDVSPPGMELDLRVGGFIPIGAEEKADDVKARVSKNEFVFTADAVKAAGGGSVNEGAKRMYDTMKRLESQVA
jgi:hypothetical protein